jgi:hypothetical protein
MGTPKIVRSLPLLLGWSVLVHRSETLWLHDADYWLGMMQQQVWQRLYWQ